MSSYEDLKLWLATPVETEGLEFKEAKSSFSRSDVARYTAAIANEGGGWLVLGVTDRPPREVVGTNAFRDEPARNKLKKHVYDKLHVAIDVDVINHTNGRVLAIAIPKRPAGQPIAHEGRYLMRVGESVQPMPPERLQAVFAEAQPHWSDLPAADDCSDADVTALLDTATYFELRDEPYPTTRSLVIARLEADGLIHSKRGAWMIPNLSAIALAKRLDAFSPELAALAPRFIHYEGRGKSTTKYEVDGVKGYAIGFAGLVGAVHRAAPGNAFDESLVRDEQKMFPIQALRELVANALLHQDFGVSGISVRIELYEDRVEVMSPGEPVLDPLRLINEDKARNERLAELFRRLGLAEKKSSGLDKVIDLVEYHQLPGPVFEKTPTRFIVKLHARREFADMDRGERVWACYQHACLRWTRGQTVTNRSLRKRFGLNDSAAASTAASKVLKETVEETLLVRDDDSAAASSRASYRPFWA